MHKDDWNCVTCLCSLQEMLGLGGSGRGQQPQMRGGPVPPQQQQPGGDSFNRYAVLSSINCCQGSSIQNKIMVFII